MKQFIVLTMEINIYSAVSAGRDTCVKQKGEGGNLGDLRDADSPFLCVDFQLDKPLTRN